jgi:hypothetical protein
MRLAMKISREMSTILQATLGTTSHAVECRYKETTNLSAIIEYAIQ